MRAACYYELIKTSARLIKIKDYYVDINDLENNNLNFICEQINNNNDNKILIKTNIYNPYVGELFVKNIKKVNNKTLN